MAGDASNATQDSFQMNQCGGASDQPGIWYSVVGNGNKHSLSMCIAGDNYGYQYDDSNNNDDDVIVSIHDGRCDTDATSCIAYETINARCSQGAVDTVQWMTLPNQTYHLQVRSAVSLPAFKGMIADAEEQTLRTRRDACDAIRDVSPNKAVDGTIDTTTANIFDDSMCGDSVERVGNFYRFFGTGKFVTANLCSVDSGNNRRNSSSNETARLSASIGVSCTMGVCLAHSPRHIASCSESHDNDGGGENGSNVRSGNLVNSHNHTIHRWLALKDRQYYIHISGSDAIDYVLSIEEDVEPLAKNTDVWTFLVISGIAFVGAMMLLRCYMCTMRPQRRRTESRKRRRYKKRRRELNPAAAC
uniref:Uncharacterized protein n=1 Tax=Craspedostauros australis TaxID=1486917 RepID=A0A7R9ZN07_9STRA